MKAILPAIAFLALGTSAFASTITINCTAVAGSNSFVFPPGSPALHFSGGSGTGSFTCSDASLGAIVLQSVTVNMFADYEFGDGTNAGPINNSAGFTFGDGGATWTTAQSSDGVPKVTTMNLATGVTVFVIGNGSSTSTGTFTNSTSGGLGGTTYVQPMTDAQTGSLLGVFSIPVTAFVDAGGFTQNGGDSIARVSVTFTFTAPTVPEPISTVLVGGGLLGLAFIGRRRIMRR